MTLFITAFITMFTITDPLGCAAVFAGLTTGHNRRTILKMAIKATLIAMGVLLFFGFVGKFILAHMGISDAALKIAGGILLFHTAFHMVLGGHEQNAPEPDVNAENIAVFPMAIPLMAGPGCATAFILLLDTARAESISILYVISATLAVQLLTCLCLISASPIKDWLGEAPLSVLARVMGIFLAALSVQFVLDGILHFLP